MRRLTAFVLSAVCIISHTGCGSGQTSNGEPGPETGQAAEVQKDAGKLENQTDTEQAFEYGAQTESVSGTGMSGNVSETDPKADASGADAQKGTGTGAADSGISAGGTQMYAEEKQVKENGQFISNDPDDYEISSYLNTVPVVYMSEVISAQSMLNLYKSIGSRNLGRNTAVKVSFQGAAGNGCLKPELIKDLVQYVNGTIVDCGAASGSLGTGLTAGFLEIAQVDRIEEYGTLAIPVRNGEHLAQNIVGTGFQNYDSFLILTHFTQNEMAGFGGSIHNISIGISAEEGRKRILEAADSAKSGGQDFVLEAMAEAGLSVADALRGNILYINVMNGDSVGCDCSDTDYGKDIHDIGIFASKDPVALDQACVDYVYMTQKEESFAGQFVDQIEAVQAEHILEYGEEIGLGNCAYTVAVIDD